MATFLQSVYICARHFCPVCVPMRAPLHPQAELDQGLPTDSCMRKPNEFGIHKQGKHQCRANSNQAWGRGKLLEARGSWKAECLVKHRALLPVRLSAAAPCAQAHRGDSRAAPALLPPAMPSHPQSPPSTSEGHQGQKGHEEWQHRSCLTWEGLPLLYLQNKSTQLSYDTALGPEEGQRAGVPLLRRQAETLGVVQPGKEKALGWP